MNHGRNAVREPLTLAIERSLEGTRANEPPGSRVNEPL